MNKHWVLIGLGVFCLLTVVLFQVKYKVVELESEIQQVNKEIFNLEEAIHILKAEWAYRSSPSRLNRLVRDHLSHLKPHRTSQLVLRSSYEDTSLALPLVQTSFKTGEEP